MRSKAASYAPVPQCEDPTRKAKDRVTSFESRIQKLETRRSRRRAHEGHEGEGHEDREDHATGVWYILKSSTGFRACHRRRGIPALDAISVKMMRTGTPSDALEFVVVDESGRQVERPDSH